MKFTPNIVTAIIVLAARTQSTLGSNFSRDSSVTASRRDTDSTYGLRGSTVRTLQSPPTFPPRGEAPPPGIEQGKVEIRPPPEEVPPEIPPVRPDGPPTEVVPPEIPPVRPEPPPTEVVPPEIPPASPEPPPPPPPPAQSGCSRNKKITLYKFCITGDHDKGGNGEHTLILNHFQDGVVKYPENKCHDLDYHPQHVEAETSLIVGTLEYDDEEEEEFIKELDPGTWYDDTCETYYVAISKTFSAHRWTGARSWTGCWFSEHPEDLQPFGLNLDHCPENYYHRPQDSFNWFLRIEAEPEHW